MPNYKETHSFFAIALMISLTLISCTASEAGHTEVLVAVNCSKKSVGAVYGSLLKRVVRNSLGRTITVAAITGRGGNNPVVSANLAIDALANPLLEQSRVEKDAKRLIRDVEGMLAVAYKSCSSSTEILAEIGSASRRMPTSGSRKLIVISHALEQSQTINLYDSRLPRDPSALLKRVQASGMMPRLPEISVCFAGVTTANDGRVNGDLALRVRNFWTAFFQETGAKIAGYGYNPSCLDMDE